MQPESPTRDVFRDLLTEEDIAAVDKTSVNLALDRVTQQMASTILEKPLRTEQDHREGIALSEESLRYLRLGASYLSHSDVRRH